MIRNNILKHFENKNVLITGVDGFIGTALSKAFWKTSTKVIGLTRSIHEPNNSPCDYKVVGSVEDFDLLCSIISEYEINCVFHLAARSIVSISKKDPKNCYSTNIMGTVNILEASRLFGVNKVIVASSDKAMGDHDTLPYKEEFELKPNNTYDTSKACADMISRTYAKQYNMNVVVTRCSNVYGPYDESTTRLIPSSIYNLLHNKAPIVYSDALQMEREFIYVDDVIDAYLMLASLDTKYNVYNIGGSGPVKICDLVDKLCAKFNLAGYVVKDKEEHFTEIQKQYIDSERLRKLGWEQKVSLDDGIKLTIDWWRQKFLGLL